MEYANSLLHVVRFCILETQKNIKKKPVAFYFRPEAFFQLQVEMMLKGLPAEGPVLVVAGVNVMMHEGDDLAEDDFFMHF